MLLRFLMALTALSLLAGGAANAQTTNSAATTGQDHPNTDETVVTDVCTADLRGFLRIAVGRPGARMVELTFDRPMSCHDSASYGGWLLFAEGTGALSMRTRENCRALKAQMAKLRWPPRSSLPEGVQAGPFLIQDYSGFFHPQSPSGRSAAERWIRQTLSLVRPCWDIPTDDRSRRLVAHLYSESSQKGRRK